MLVTKFCEGHPMNPANSESSAWAPQSAEDKERVRQQINRLLETHHFRNSRRYPVLLRFLVEETLEGRGELLKERLIGVRVFDRPADYDTAEDPIVRVTVAEIRKRIAQYYYEEAHDSEMRIELIPGHYIPEFRPGKDDGAARQTQGSLPPAASAQNGDIAPSSQEEEDVPQAARARLLPRRIGYALGLALPLLAAATVWLGWKGTHKPAIDEFWQPFLGDSQSAVFCVPVDANRGSSTAAEAGVLVNGDGSIPASPAAPTTPATARPSSTFLAHEVLGENIVFSDALAVLRVSNYLARRNLQIDLRPNNITTLDDLRHGSMILVGGLDNQWTLRALAGWRYRFAGTYQEQYWIVDAKNPNSREWALDLNLPLSQVKRDFAIIARVHDESTGQIEIVVAGIGMSGTAAAGEFLVDPAQMEQLRRRVGQGFRDHDFEAVLSTDVVDGIAGSPRILAMAIR